MVQFHAKILCWYCFVVAHTRAHVVVRAWAFNRGPLESVTSVHALDFQVFGKILFVYLGDLGIWVIMRARMTRRSDRDIL